MHFSATPTSTLTVPIQDHGVKYVSHSDAEIIGFFDTLFYLFFLPFLAAAIGEMGLKAVREDEAKDRN